MTKTLAIMQPYLFPYLGYFQLVANVDEFIFYDDVHFIKQGWINRNKILVNQSPCLFSVPIKQMSSNRLILDTEIDQCKFQTWQKKFKKTLKQNYKHSKYHDLVFDVLAQVWDRQPKVSAMASASVMACSKLLGLRTAFKFSSKDFPKRVAGAKERLWMICRETDASVYINAMGGEALYNREEFSNQGVQLQFLEPDQKLVSHPLYNLSILHFLLEWGPEQTKKWIAECRII